MSTNMKRRAEKSATVKGTSVNRFAALAAAALSWCAAAEETRQISPKHNVLEESPKAAKIQIGASIGKLTLKTVDGKPLHIGSELPTLIVFVSSKCPVANRYAARLNRLRNAYEGRAQIAAVFSNADETEAGVRKHAEAYQYRFASAVDSGGELARRFGATMTPQAFALDSKGTLRYRGAVDDNRIETRVTERYAENALAALVAGSAPLVAETAAFGCAIHLPEIPEKAATKITYAEHIAPILQKRCQVCHRTGEVAPFTLLSYEDAKTWAAEIAYYTEARLMPPWKPDPGFGEFKNNRSMSDEEIRLIGEWVKAGAPIGDLAKAPKPLKFTEGWALGEPDYVIEMEREYLVQPEGEDEYRHFVIPTNFEQDMYVQSVDVEPGNRQTVHHVIIYLDVNGEARKLDAQQDGYGYATSGGGAGFEVSGTLGGWAPGISPTVLPDGVAYLLPKGADIVLQVHYYRTGKPERDLSKAGLYFSKSPNPAPLRIGSAINTDFEIPAGAKKYPVAGARKLDSDIVLLGVLPHMHLIGTDMKLHANLPDGKKIDLIYISNWDFNWQDIYHYKQPIYLPKGSSIEMLAHYDNTAGNPNNPNDPPIPVGWGEKTTDEMAIGFFYYVLAEEYEQKTASADPKQPSEN